MAYIPLEKLVKNNESHFKLILTAAARANELSQGAQPLVKSDSTRASTVALQEIAEGKVRYAETKTKGKKASS